MTQAIVAQIMIAYQTLPTAQEMTNAWGSFGLALAFLLAGIAWLAFERKRLLQENKDLQSNIEEMWGTLLSAEQNRSKQVESNVKAMEALNQHLENRLKDQTASNNG